MNGMPINLLIMVLFLGGAIFLQLKLSRTESKLPGLILPGLTFLYSLMGAIGYASFYTISSTSEMNGEIIEQTSQSGGTVGMLVGFVLMMLYMNIPTLVLLLLYFSERKKGNRKKDIERMKIEDL